MGKSDSRTFEQALAEIEKIVRELEDGIELQQSLERYEQGVGLLRHCYDQLRKVEQRIVELAGADDAGNPVLRPFDHVSAMKQE